MEAFFEESAVFPSHTDGKTYNEIPLNSIKGDTNHMQRAFFKLQNQTVEWFHKG